MKETVHKLKQQCENVNILQKVKALYMGGLDNE